MLALLVVALALMGARAQGADASDLMVSDHPDRSDAVALEGRSYGESDVIYVFLKPADGAQHVAYGFQSASFSLDGEEMSATPREFQNTAPFDFKTTDGGEVQGFAVGELSDGSHTIAARIFGPDGSTITDSATFDVRSSLRFADNFSGSAVNLANWSPWYSRGHGGNGLRRPSAISVSNGNLVVTAKMIDGKIVSGGMAQRINSTYGRFEFRARTDVDPVGAMSGVVLTWPKRQWSPEFTENDIYETGKTPGTRRPFRTFIHYGSNSQKYFVHQSDASDWHTMAMDWRPGALKIYRDGALVWTTTERRVIPDVLHHMTIQLDARVNRRLTSTVRMYVDWVKIYS